MNVVETRSVYGYGGHWFVLGYRPRGGLFDKRPSRLTVTFGVHTAVIEARDDEDNDQYRLTWADVKDGAMTFPDYTPIEQIVQEACRMIGPAPDPNRILRNRHWAMDGFWETLTQSSQSKANDDD